MKRLPNYLPTVLTVAIAIGLLIYGPIPQLAHYHEFADRRLWLGIPNAADVLSNTGFALIGLWGLWRLWPLRHHPALAVGWPGWCLFLVSLIATAIGSSYYHLAPDDLRLVWDRLPIAFACAGLLSAVHAEARGKEAGMTAVLLSVAAVASVLWWQTTADLRPYLLLQGLPLLLVPLWQADAPSKDRVAFAVAIGLYVAAKLAELSDHQLLHVLGFVSGHTLKHLLAVAAAVVIVTRLKQRVMPARQNQPGLGYPKAHLQE
ncbi:hypothetical protein [Andreprevotia chitinilytica]|uniref:hypothetical protein n=1 Tax=Andreprevotia chitinilytica TaxID=396808 RepID=UPI00068AFF70|nr:hypothetical protein [Andreprevotia chitinilytica]